jgi:prepilin-type N-terminal cleavage/methylation domain-containing protein
MSLFNNRKGFTLLELLIVIGIITVLSTTVMLTISGSKQKAVDAKAKYNRQTARMYCALNPGISEHHGDTVAAYCWSSIGGSDTDAWYVYFGSGYVAGDDKTGSKRVRCVLGQ